MLLKNACNIPCSKLQPWKDCSGNLKFIYEKMALKISTFLKDDYLNDYLTRCERATDKLNYMRNHYNKNRNECFTNRKVRCYCCSSEKHKLYSCEQFFNWEGISRLDFVVRSGLCSNCLVGKHFEHTRHHILLHETYIYSMFHS